MKSSFRFLPLLAASLLAVSCSTFLDILLGGNAVEASANVITETREASGISGVDMRAIGRVVISQGDAESLTARGSDNILAMITTSVRGGTLVIEMEKNFAIKGLNDSTTPVFTIVVKDLSRIKSSGFGELDLDGLTAPRLEATFSGAGKVALRNLALEELLLDLGGVGDVTLSGSAVAAEIHFSGVGTLDAADLKIQTAAVYLSGPGNATLWVTENLKGVISGSGNVEYYGDPKTDTGSTGSGSFKALGGK
ncbi:MAG: head GIN domain-containing protein [Anaerolineales bacterium]